MTCLRMKLLPLCAMACLRGGFLAAYSMGTNVVGGGIATQSSNRDSADRAIDGDTGKRETCATTRSEDEPWWRLDLLQKHQIWSVRITNTEGDPSEGIDGAEIRIGDSLHNSGNSNPRCATVQSLELGASETYKCGGMQGRYINIVRPGNKKRLTLCEVEIFGQPLFLVQAC